MAKFSLEDFTSSSSLQGKKKKGNIYSLEDFTSAPQKMEGMPSFADVESGNSLDPLAGKFHKMTEFSIGDNTFNPIDMLGGLIGAPASLINAGARGGARMMGLPVGDDATAASMIGEIVHPSGNAAPSIIADAAASTINPISSLVKGIDNPYLNSVSKGATEKASQMAFDPSSILFAGGALPPALHYGMTGLLGHGMATQGLSVVDEVKKNGFTPAAVEHLVGLGADGLLLALGSMGQKERAAAQEIPEIQVALQEKGISLDPGDPLAPRIMPEEPPPTGKQEAPIRMKPLPPESIPMQPELAPGETALPNVWNGEPLRGEPLPEMVQRPGEGSSSIMAPLPEIDFSRIPRVDEGRPIPQERVKGSEMLVEEEGILSPEEQTPLPIELKATIQEALSEGDFKSNKASIKALEEKLGIPREEAKELFWKTKKALSKEKESGVLPLEELEESKTDRVMGKDEFFGETSPFQRDPVNVDARLKSADFGTLKDEYLGKTAPLTQNESSSVTANRDMLEYVSEQTKKKAINNPHLQKLKRWAENVFPEARESADRALPGRKSDTSKSKLTALEYDPQKLGSRMTGNFLTPGGKTYVEGRRGEVALNPWQIAREIAWKVKKGEIAPSEAPRAFGAKMIDTLSHENAHVGVLEEGRTGDHGKAKNIGRYKEMDPEGFYDPSSAKREFSFKTAHESVMNDPLRRERMEGILSDVNAKDLKAMYESIRDDDIQMFREISEGKAKKMGPPPPEGRKYTQTMNEDSSFSPLEGLDLKKEPKPATAAQLGIFGKETGAVGVGGKGINPNAPVPPLNIGPATPVNPTPKSPKGKAQQAVVPTSIIGKVINEVKDISSAVRVITVGGDVSSPFRQSWIQTFAHPIQGAKNLKVMAKALREKGYENLTKEVEASPYYDAAKKAKLHLGTDEQYQGVEYLKKRLGKVPVANLGVEGLAATERGYNAYLKATRMDSFSRGMEVLEGKHGKGKVPLEAQKALARWINTSTGRGQFSSAHWERAAGDLNKVLFSPRLLKSRLDVFDARVWNPESYWRKLYKDSPDVAMMAAKDLTKSVALMSSLVGLAAANGAKVEGDPRSSDFGMIRFGNSRIDPWGGYQQYVRYSAQLLSGKRKTQYDELKDVKVGDILQQFTRSKLAPIPGFAWTAKEGKNFIGRRAPLDDPKTYWETFGPMALRDMAEVYDEDPGLGIAMIMPIALGLGVTTREPLKASKEVQDEYSRLKIRPPMDVQTLVDKSKGGEKDPLTGKIKFPRRELTGEEFKSAKEKGDSMAFSEVEKFIKSPSYQNLSEEEKRKALNRLSRRLGGAKRKAAERLLLKPPPQ